MFLLVMYNIGYVKDFLACILFLVCILCLIQIKDLNRYKTYIFIAILLGFTIDGIFSLNKDYHCLNVGYNLPTYILIIAVVCFVMIFLNGLYFHFRSY